MNRKKGIGLMMVFLMVFSTFPIVNAVHTTTNLEDCESNINTYFQEKSLLPHFAFPDF